ncbi:MAG: NADPH-dependent assimilatory sulfite reductase hemoprotein subunit [Rickettsiales bacterium]|nr:NADPH-dependent assimilatory sulfite reductase hemoprotein subunit [Rickettsiales bacterium]
MTDKIKLSEVEKIKIESNYLRGSLEEGFNDPLTGSICESDTQLIKFHGSYQQDDRESRSRRAQKKLEKSFSFMLRLRIPGGRVTAKQMLNIFKITDDNATGIVKITTRQTIQLHGIIKSKLKPTLQFFDKFDLDSIAACGDVNRNIVTGSNFEDSDQNSESLHTELIRFTRDLSKKFLPHTKAYREIWLDAEKISEDENEEQVEPIYGKVFLPRKFKMGIAIPPFNDIDVYANDFGLVAIIEAGKLVGFNVLAGGGMGATHGNEETYPRLASEIGFITPEQALDIAEAVVTFQRDNGNRSNRKLSRLKYTIDKVGLVEFKADVEKRSGIKFAPLRSVEFKYRNDVLGWRRDYKGDWHYTVFTENGRIMDQDLAKFKTAIREISELDISEFQFTANQNLSVANIKEQDKAKVDAVLNKYGIIDYQKTLSEIRIGSMACVAFNTCGLALAEGQRYMPSLITKLEPLLARHGLADKEITIRMTGCPNGCARPYVAEIGFVGTSLGKYNFHLGGDRLGMRLNTKYKESLDEAQILSELDGFFELYSREGGNQDFGDFIHQHISNK